jgi:SAM-dependent methyltransferase
VEDPEELIKEAHRLLSPDGVLIMETPDEGCLARKMIRAAHRVSGGRRSYLRRLYYVDHRWYFSNRAMALVLRRVGFDHIQFFREVTVKEFGMRKAQAYGILRTLPQYFGVYALGLLGAVPWFRNKMVVMATKGSI